MPTSVLVGYATNYGSTKEVAEKVAEVLRECGLTVDIHPMKNVHSLDTYSAVVIGAPLIMFRWHKDARNFLSKHQKSFEKMPVALFALGPVTDPYSEKEWQASRDQLNKEMASFPWLSPIAHELFGGKFDPADLRWPMNVFASKAPKSDIRDWDAISAWARELAPKLVS